MRIMCYGAVEEMNMDNWDLNDPQDTDDTGQYYEDYQKIAEHVVHVDCSVNGYFMVYLTENGDLYGVGDNMDGLMMNDVSEDPEYDIYTINPGENINIHRNC